MCSYIITLGGLYSHKVYFLCQHYYFQVKKEYEESKASSQKVQDMLREENSSLQNKLVKNWNKIYCNILTPTKKIVMNKMYMKNTK